MKSTVFPKIYHLGCMKTGTTTLQELWAKDPRINLILHSRYFNTEKFESDFDYSSAYGCNLGKIDVESDENISRRINKMQGLSVSLKRIKSVSPEAKIVLTVRHPKDMLISMYKHVIRQTDHTYTIEEFMVSPEGRSFIETIKYGEVVEEVMQYFDRGQLFIFRQEDFKSDPNLFLERFYSDVFEIPFNEKYKDASKNIGRNDQQIAWKRKVNAWKMTSNNGFSSFWNKMITGWVLKFAYRITTNSTKRIYTWDKFSEASEIEQEISASLKKYESLMGHPLEYNF